MKRRVLLSSTTLLFCRCIVGCSGAVSSPAPATAEDYDDVAQALGTVVVTSSEGAGPLSDSADLSVGVVPVGLAATGAGEFGGNRLGVDYRYRLSCEDGAGAALAQCGTATETAEAGVDARGQVGLPGFSASLVRQAEWSLSGVQTGSPIFDGDDSLVFDAEFQSLFRPETLAYHVDAEARYDRVTVQRSTHAVVGGAIHFTVTATRSGAVTDGTDGASTGAHAHATATPGGSFEMTADVTFSAGASTLVLDGSHTYTVDIATGRVTPVGSQ